jgi:hypothetical protein
MFEVLLDEAPQAGVGSQVIARAEEPEQPAERIEREHLSPAYVRPDAGQLVGSVDGLGPRR